MTDNREPIGLVVAKALVASAGVCLFMYPLATTTGLVAAALGTIAAYVAARYAYAAGLRTAAALVLAALLAGLGRVTSQWVLDHPVGTLSTALELSDVLACGLGAFALFFAVRMLAQRWRVFSVLEVAVVVGAVAHTFAAHRHHHIHEPRFFTDWAWSHGIDPLVVLEGFAVAAVIVAALVLLDVRRASKLLVSLLFIGGSAFVAYWLLGGSRINVVPDTNGIALGSNQKQDGSGGGSGGGKGGGGGGGGGRSPDPVAVVVLHDELPEADVLYFRQAVLSRFAVDRLAEDTTGKYDLDVIGRFPSTAPVRVVSPQVAELHRLLRTSVYLLVDHAQPFGLGHPVEVRQLQNPNPRQFVAAYDVDSYFFDQDYRRLAGRTAIPASWTAEDRDHYLAMPDDPRYAQMSSEIVRDMDPRFVGDDLMKALALKRYLEKNGFYSLAEKTLVGTDPTAKFLFGAKRGYCVHFAHAMAMLLRSQGIPSRVALGYAVQTQRRGAGSSILIFGNEAHAWPELYIDGVGWVTMDVYPEASDEPPPTPVDEDLESMLGELARKDETGGKAADPNTRLRIPWDLIGGSLGAFAAGAVLAAYFIKLLRRMRRRSARLVYLGVLDRLSDLGLVRELGETRERHAARIASLAPSFVKLTNLHLRYALGGAPEELPQFVELARHTRAELGTSMSLWRRLGAAFHPVGWWFTR